MKSIVKSGLGAAIIAVCALISLPFPVPFTLQTLGVFCISVMLDIKSAVSAIAVYIAVGAVGLPVFSGMQGGFQVLFGVTGGYIFGFLAAPFIIRYFKGRMFIRMITAQCVIYAIGTVWYAAITGAGVAAILTTCVIPFIIPDVIKIYIALKIKDKLTV